MNPKHEPTLKELMARQGKLSSSAKPAQKAAPQKKADSQPKRTEAEKQEKASQLAEMFNKQINQKYAGASKEDKIREMVEKDPEAAAALLRKMFLNK